MTTPTIHLSAGIQGKNDLYKTLDSFINLDRIVGELVLEWNCGTGRKCIMKRIILLSGFVVAILAVGVVVARANVRGWNGCTRHGWGHGRASAYLAHELNLNAAQKQQVQSMWQAERPTVSGLIHEFAAENKEMDQATANGNLDKEKVEEIAGRQGATLSKLLIEKENFKTKVYTSVLTPEQRVKADKLQSRWYEHLDQIGKRME